MDYTNMDDTSPIHPPDRLDELKKSIGFPSCRATMALLCFLGFFNVYTLRTNLSVAIVAMVNSSYAQGPGYLNSSECGEVFENGSRTYHEEGEFNWDNELQGYILGSFYWGFITTQLLGGRLAEMYGTKYLFGGSILISSVLNFLSPVMAKWSPYAFIALRVVMGIVEGVCYPVMYCILAHWCPPLERSRMATFVYSGDRIGTVVGMLLTGVICDRLGWEWAFYLFGIIGCVWFLAFYFLVYDTPASHPRISPVERKYIEESIGPQIQRPAVPWRDLLTSGPFWALVLAQVSFSWGGYTLSTSLPKYLHEVLHFDVKQNGFLSSLPYVLQFIVQISGGQLADWLIKRQVFSVQVVRKLFCALGCLFPAVSLFAVAFLGCNPSAAVAFLILGTGLGGLAMSGYGTNFLDIAPVFAGTMMGIASTLSSIPGFLAPEVVGWITNSGSSLHQWQKVFFIATAVYLFGLVEYVILGSGELQQWAKTKAEEEDDVAPSALDHSSSRNAIITPETFSSAQ